MLAKFNINDRVICKKTGPINTGRILGLTCPKYWMINNGSYPTEWEMLYPDFAEKPVYLVLLDHPSKNLTKEKVMAEYPNKDLAETYYQMIPTHNMLSYPEDDLELL